ncbi:hypothetical protein IV203_008959 [Nitzschia inconspicua]|uniref:Uncharacterized protein n=1 Tax=Nitzschia inconspicua TaxID=303405 RepID=A0A9K3L161_9STRA|nr:hypothetical protein IV203_008959 [Nitzschia inconspicua]
MTSNDLFQLNQKDTIGKEIHSSVFTQDHIGALREALYRGLLPNAEWATLESVSSFFPALLPPVRNEPSPDQDGALVHETGPEVEEPKEDEEVVTGTHPENFIHDVEDEIFERKFSEPSQVFQTVEELMVVINDYQETSGNSLAIRRSRGSSRAFACISHANCSFRVAFGPKARQEGIILKRGNCNLWHSGAAVTAAKDGRCLKKRSKEVIKELANDVALHKHAPPTANDVIKAGVHKKKTLLSYKQCYRGVNARNESKIISDPMSFQLVGPYVEAFAQRNPGSTAFMERGSDNRIQSEWKGTLYLATVKSAGDDLYPVAFAITVDGEDFHGWLWFLQHLKLPPRYGFRNSNISESANNMFHDARNGNWLDAIDGILIKMSLRITKSQSKYEGKDGVVDNILGLATKRWENCVGCRVYASGNDGETYSVYQKLGGELEEEALLKVRPVDCVCDCGKWQAIGVPFVHGMAYFRHQM